MSGQDRPLKRKIRSTSHFWNIQKGRYAVQLGFAVFIGLLIYRKIIAGESSGSAVPSAEAYCPLGGLETLYRYITTGGQFVSHTHLSNLVLFIAVVISAVLAKSYFCGWICPFGALQQAITGTRRWLQNRIKFLKALARWMSRRTRGLTFLDRWLRYGKYLMLAWILWGTITYGVMVFRDIDPWAAIINIAEAAKGTGFVVLIGVLVAAVFGNRVWCRYACPLSPVIGLLGKLSPVKVQRDDSTCNGCTLCTIKCPMYIKVHAMSRVSAVDCTMCLSCIESCPIEGALELRLALPGIETEKPVPVKGTET